ncbi:MAG: molybdate ABC transporter substrate-binding protein [Sphingobium sp.]
MTAVCKRLIFFVLALTLLGALVSAQPALAKAPLVLAASSLQESLTAVADRWTAKGHARPTLSFAASSALARQIEAGAPADLFLSADEDWMNNVAAKGLIRRASRVTLLNNRLVLVAPEAHPISLRIARGFPLVRALGDGRLAMADPDAVPAGKYAKAALTSLGVWPSVEPRIARAENVRAALQLVARREAPLGIVYATDARATPGVKVAGIFPTNSHPPILYPAALLTASTSPDAEGFRRFLLSHEAKAIFAHYGFGVR